MNGLAGARVLLIDDKAEEATPVIKAFSRVGVPIAYFDGNTGAPPASRRLRGVRLAILDMNLGFSGSQETIASVLVQALAKIMSPDNGPYGVLVWTGHPDLKTIVSRYLYQHTTLPKPVFIEMLKKSSFSKTRKDGTRRFAMAKLSKALVSALAEHSPLKCLQVWEGASFNAATSVVNRVSESSGEGSIDLDSWKKGWSEDTLRMLKALGKAKAEQLFAHDNCLPSVFKALNPLQSDRLDASVSEDTAGLSDHVDKIMAATGATKPVRSAKLNSMLHLASDYLEDFNAGNFYVFAKNKRAAFMPTLKELVTDAAEGKDATKAANVATLTAGGRLCGVEITPVCDHAQKKLGLSRVISGFIIPADLGSKAKGKADSLKRLGPFFLKGGTLAAGSYLVLLNSRYVASAAPNAVLASTPKPHARIRAQLLADIQAWAAYQGSRQGFTILP